MKRYYFVAVTSDAKYFEDDMVAYPTKEQAREGLKIVFEEYKNHVIESGFDDDMHDYLEDDSFIIRYNDDYSYYHGEIKSGVVYDSNEKPGPLKLYRVAVVKSVLAYSEEDAIFVANNEDDLDIDYDTGEETHVEEIQYQQQ